MIPLAAEEEAADPPEMAPSRGGNGPDLWWLSDEPVAVRLRRVRSDTVALALATAP